MAAGAVRAGRLSKLAATFIIRRYSPPVTGDTNHAAV